MTTTLPTMDPPLSSKFYPNVYCCKGEIDRKRAVIWENEKKAWQEKNYLSCLGHALLSRIVNLSCLYIIPIDLCICTGCSACSIYNCFGGYVWFTDPYILRDRSGKEASELGILSCALGVNECALACLSCAHASVQTCCCPTNLLCPEMYNLYCLERIDLSLNQQEGNKFIEYDDLYTNYKLADANYKNSASTTTQVNTPAPVVIDMEAPVVIVME